MEKDTKTVLIESAERLIAEKGYHNTTIEDITRDAGVAKGTFYTYFKTKEDILFEIFEYRTRDYTAEMDNIEENNLTIDDKLLKITESNIRFALKHQGFFMLVFKIMQNMDKETSRIIRQKHLEAKLKMMNQTERILKDGMAKGYIKSEYASRTLDIANMFDAVKNQHIFFLFIKNKKNILESCNKEELYLDIDSINVEEEARFIVNTFTSGIIKQTQNGGEPIEKNIN